MENKTKIILWIFAALVVGLILGYMLGYYVITHPTGSVVGSQGLVGA